MNEIETAIRTSLPDLIINSIENLGEGDFCRAFLFNEKLVFRFAKHETARQSLRRENCLLPKIAGQITLRIPLPEFSAFDGVAEDSFIVYEFLPDAALTPEEYLKLDEETRTLCAGQAAQFLNEFHSIDLGLAEKCGVLRIDYAAKYTDLLNRIREKFFRRLEREVFELAEKEIENFLESATKIKPVLLHGDFSPDHVLFDKKLQKVTSIIDFGDMMIGDAAWDFLWIFEDYGADFFERVVSSYGAANQKKFAARVRQFSMIEAVQWIADSFTENDLAEAVEHLKRLKKGIELRLQA